MKRNCFNCRKEFITYLSRVKIEKGKYCSKICSDEVILFKKGRISEMKGKKMTKAQKSKINISGLKLGHGWNKGKKRWWDNPASFKKGMIPWNKGLEGFMGGENHWNWQGGITPHRKKLHELYVYKKWKEAVKKRDNYACIWCGAEERLEVDHIKRWKEYPEFRHEISNGRTLCHNCHVKTETYGNRRIYAV